MRTIAPFALISILTACEKTPVEGSPSASPSSEPARVVEPASRPTVVDEERDLPTPDFHDEAEPDRDEGDPSAAEADDAPRGDQSGTAEPAVEDDLGADDEADELGE